MTTISEFMTAHPHTIGHDMPLRLAHERMRALGVRHLPVLDGGRLVGVVSQRDLYLLETFRDVTADDAKVEEAMTADPYVVAPKASLREVAAEMARRKIGTAIVVEGRHVVGIFTAVDALRALA